MPRLGSDGRRVGGGELKGGSRGASGGGSVMGAGGYVSGALKKDKDYGPGTPQHSDKGKAGTKTTVTNVVSVPASIPSSMSGIPGYTPALADFQAANIDYKDVANSFGDNVLNAIAGVFGFKEIQPDWTDPATYEDGKASWGWDPIKSAATLAGAAGIGGALPTVVGVTNSLLGNPLTVNLGPTVFDGTGGPPPTQVAGNQNNNGGGWGNLVNAPSAPGAPAGGGGGPATPTTPAVTGVAGLPAGVNYSLPIGTIFGNVVYQPQSPFSANIYGRRSGWGSLISV